MAWRLPSGRKSAAQECCEIFYTIIYVFSNAHKLQFWLIYKGVVTCFYQILKLCSKIRIYKKKRTYLNIIEIFFERLVIKDYNMDKSYFFRIKKIFLFPQHSGKKSKKNIDLLFLILKKLPFFIASTFYVTRIIHFKIYVIFSS